MTTDRPPPLTDRLSGPAWVRRFDPDYFVREVEASGSVTDKHRAHRAPKGSCPGLLASAASP